MQRLNNRVLDLLRRWQYILNVSADRAKSAARNILSDLGLPDDTAGQFLQLVTFQSDDDCRFFYPRRALAWQQQVNTYISRELRKRGLRIQRITLQRSDYENWREGRADTEELRRKFADQHLLLVPKVLDQALGKK